ncbi:hypothetical protein L6452_01134 [Arctium lappa]|uniref:Uncharacterized protein n=1 Tax=Arctium lappa TaxID=4217 RepID=A0ACB9FGP1_ARCLA|nr:hypothetical protein L6452_01134 [Arctium lappa]
MGYPDRLEIFFNYVVLELCAVVSPENLDLFLQIDLGRLQKCEKAVDAITSFVASRPLIVDRPDCQPGPLTS